MDDYFYERLSVNNIQDIIPVYLNAFKKKVTVDHLIKKHNTSQIGPSFLGYIAYTKGRSAIAFYGVFVCQIEFNGKFYLGAQAGDTMTHSFHSGKGLFTKLALKTQDLCESLGIEVLFAFPNQNSFPGFVKKLGWSHFDDLTTYLIRVKCIPWIRLKNTFKFPQALHDKWCRYNLKKITKGTPFKSSCLLPETAVVDHSTAFFEYKIYSENYLIQLNGINVWVKFDDTFLFIGDIEKCTEADFQKMMHALKKIAFKMGLPHLRFHASYNTWAEQLFKKYGVPMQTKYPIVGINFSNSIPIEKLKFTGADNDTF